MNNEDRVVYVLNKGPHDYSAAEKFGTLQFCTTGLIDRKDIAQMHREVNKAMELSQPDDLIVLVSLSSLCSVACAIFANVHGRLNLLIWQDGTYVERTIVL